MKLFTVGPAQMYAHTLKVRNQVVPYFRTSEFSALMKENEILMKQMVDAPVNTKMVLLTASGSGAMEATVWNCFGRTDKLLVISGGTFGERFEQICKIHDIPYTAVKLGPDEMLTEEHLLPYEEQGYTGLLVNHHETYTGQLYNIQMIGEFCKRNNMYLVVDAISSFLCDPYSMNRCGADITIVSSQKGLCLAPGISIVMISERMQKKIWDNDIKCMYFDFKDYLKNMERGQTPFTPAVGVCYELNDMLRYISDQGIENRLREVKERCKYFRKRIEGLPIELPNFPLSNAITPCRFKKDIATELFNHLKE